MSDESTYELLENIRDAVNRLTGRIKELGQATDAPKTTGEHTAEDLIFVDDGYVVANGRHNGQHLQATFKAVNGFPKGLILDVETHGRNALRKIIAGAVDRAIFAEREACLSIADGFNSLVDENQRAAAFAIAKAIRARP